MLNFAEQTGSGAVMLVWSFLISLMLAMYIYFVLYTAYLHFARNSKQIEDGMAKEALE